MLSSLELGVAGIGKSNAQQFLILLGKYIVGSLR